MSRTQRMQPGEMSRDDVDASVGQRVYMVESPRFGDGVYDDSRFFRTFADAQAFASLIVDDDEMCITIIDVSPDGEWCVTAHHTPSRE